MTADRGCTVIRGARIFDGERLRDAGPVLLADGIIAGVGPGLGVPADAEALSGAHARQIEATSAPARLFGPTDRGRIASGLRADLLLVDGDPCADITATRNITAIWRNGTRLHRQPRPAPPPR
jgi:hypothetical protein